MTRTKPLMGGGDGGTTPVCQTDRTDSLSVPPSLCLPLFLAAPEMREDPPLRRRRAYVGDGIARVSNVDGEEAQTEETGGEKISRKKLAERWEMSTSVIRAKGEAMITDAIKHTGMIIQQVCLCYQESHLTKHEERDRDTHKQLQADRQKTASVFKRHRFPSLAN